MLIKVRVPPGPARAEVMQLVDVFRARVVDVSEKTLTLAVTGDAGKVSCASRQTEYAELPIIACAAVQGMSACTTVALHDCQDCRIGRPYRDAQDRLLWKDKTCPAHT